MGGVLPHIALVFIVCALLFLYTKRKAQLIIASVILVLWWVMKYLPIPGIGMPDLSEPGKTGQLFDQITTRLFVEKTWDPEGILSSFPAVVTGLLGMMVDDIDIKVELKDKLLLFIMAGTLLILGDVFNT